MKSRIEIIDALRGLSIILMVAYHCGFDLFSRGYIPYEVLYNPLLDFLQFVFGSVFIILAGVSSRFSQNNIKRGFVLLGSAVLVTLASAAAGEIIWFGILHMLACCVFLYVLFERLKITVPAIVALAFFATYFGLSNWPDIPSSDYFMLIPWIFMFFLGVWLGQPIRDGKFPKWFYRVKIPVLPVIGRHTLLIYLVHQPVLFGVLRALELI